MQVQDVVLYQFHILARPLEPVNQYEQVDSFVLNRSLLLFLCFLPQVQVLEHHRSLIGLRKESQIPHILLDFLQSHLLKQFPLLKLVCFYRNLEVRSYLYLSLDEGAPYLLLDVNPVILKPMPA